MMDHMRSGRHSLMQTFNAGGGEPPPPVPIVWYRTPPNTPSYEGPTVFRSRNYSDPRDPWFGIGENSYPERCCKFPLGKWYGKTPQTCALPGRPCPPDPVVARDGAVYPAGAYDTDIFGIPPCCSCTPVPQQTMSGGEREGGTLAQGRQPYIFGVEGEKEGGSMRQWKLTPQYVSGGEKEGGTAYPPIAYWVGGEREGGSWISPIVVSGGEREGGSWISPIIVSGGEVEGGEWSAGSTLGQDWAGGEREGRAWGSGLVPYQPGAGGEREGGSWGSGLAPYQAGAGGEREGGSWAAGLTPPAAIVSYTPTDSYSTTSFLAYFSGPAEPGDVLYILLAVNTLVGTTIPTPPGCTADILVQFSPSFYLASFWQIAGSGPTPYVEIACDLTDQIAALAVTIRGSGAGLWDVGTAGTGTSLTATDGGIVCTQGNQTSLWISAVSGAAVGYSTPGLPWSFESYAASPTLSVSQSSGLGYGPQGSWSAPISYPFALDWIAIVLAFKVP